MQESDQFSHKAIIIQKSIKSSNKLNNNEIDNKSGNKTELHNIQDQNYKYSNQNNKHKLEMRKRGEGKEFAHPKTRF